MNIETKVIHSAIKPDVSTGAIMTPIFQTSTYVQDPKGVQHGNEYARTHNPTRQVLEENIASLENGKYGVCFASGLAASDAILKLLNPGDEVICTHDLYGGTYRLMTKIFGKYGIKFHFVDLTSADNITECVNKNTKLVWIETPTNPVLSIIDIAAIAHKLEGSDALLVVDNTFASPFLQNPLDLGADIVVHSATKYLGGHSDVIHGTVIVNEDKLYKELKFIQNAVGAVPGPQDCFLILRGIKTLHLRVQRACENAVSIAKYLLNHPKIGHVNFPGLPSHPNHEVAARQMKYFGAMLSFDLKNNTMDNANKVLTGTQLFSLAESLGGVESLIGHPASMTHASIPREQRIASGVTDSLIRLSIGVEHIDDLIADLDRALDLI